MGQRQKVRDRIVCFEGAVKILEDTKAALVKSQAELDHARKELIRSIKLLGEGKTVAFKGFQYGVEIRSEGGRPAGEALTVLPFEVEVLE